MRTTRSVSGNCYNYHLTAIRREQRPFDDLRHDHTRLPACAGCIGQREWG